MPKTMPAQNLWRYISFKTLFQSSVGSYCGIMCGHHYATVDLDSLGYVFKIQDSITTIIYIWFSVPNFIFLQAPEFSG